MFDVVILAGGGRDEPLTKQEGVSHKAFINLCGRPMLAYILDALAGVASVGKVIIVGPKAKLFQMLEQGYSFTPVPEKKEMLANVSAGLQAVAQRQLCLVLTGDIPLIVSDTIKGFLELCKPFDGDFYYPVLTRESCRKRFPQMKRTYVRLKDGCFTGGNMALLRPDWFSRSRHQLDQFIAYRKNPLRLLRILPLSFIPKFLSNRLAVSDLENYLSKKFSAKIYAVPCNFVEIGTDVDKISDLEVVRQALRQKRSSKES